MNVVILQKYLTPYRLPLFNVLAGDKGCSLTVMLYGRPEQRRKWSSFEKGAFAIRQAWCLTVPLSYEKNFSIPFSLVPELLAMKPDVIICAPDFGGSAALVVTKLTKARLLIWSEATPVTDGTISWLKQKLRSVIYGASAGFIVPGTLAEQYIRRFQPGASIYYANNAVDERQFASTEQQVREKFAQPERIITFSGSLVERKGIRYLLEAFARLNQEEPELARRCRLNILGTGPLSLAEYQADNICFTGFLHKEEYTRHIRQSHLFVLPSLRDCNPLTTIEALLAGNVLVLSDKVGNYPEAVQGNGVVVSSHSATAIYDALIDLLSRPSQELVTMALTSLVVADAFTTANSLSGFRQAITAAPVRSR